MPNPQPREKEAHYIKRYVKSKESQKRFPDIKQRLAVAYSEFERGRKRK
jgi:hypothetical protein